MPWLRAWGLVSALPSFPLLEKCAAMGAGANSNLVMPFLRVLGGVGALPGTRGHAARPPLLPLCQAVPDTLSRAKENSKHRGRAPTLCCPAAPTVDAVRLCYYLHVAALVFLCRRRAGGEVSVPQSGARDTPDCRESKKGRPCRDQQLCRRCSRSSFQKAGRTDRTVFLKHVL